MKKMNLHTMLTNALYNCERLFDMDIYADNFLEETAPVVGKDGHDENARFSGIRGRFKK